MIKEPRGPYKPLDAVLLEAVRAAVGTTPQGHAQWLLTFAAIPDLEAEEELRVGLELSLFVPTPRAPERMDAIDIRPWYQAARKLVAVLRDGKAWIVRHERRFQLGPGRILRRSGPLRPDPRLYVAPMRKRDKANNRFADVLAAVGDDLRRCPVCGEPFVRRGRQSYCTPRCGGRARTRRHRQRRAPRTKPSESPP